MAPRKPKSARSLAIDVLIRTDPKRNHVAEILNSLLDRTGERQRATDLVFGTVRNRGAIDAVITKFSSRQTDRIPPRLLNIIRVGAYELIYRPEIPDYSIVNEAVENTKARAGKKQVGFVNAVLRNITRQISDRKAPLADAEAKAVVPQDPSSGCLFKTAFFPDPASEPADYLSTAFSLPKWLTADWLAEFGFEKTRGICFGSNRRPGVYIRPNPLKTTIEALAEKLRQGDIEFDIAADASMIRISSGKTVTQLPGFAEGLFAVQDLTASRAVRMLAPKPGSKILDHCAAPGVKATQLAEITGDSAEIIATDINPDRLILIEQNTARLGITSVKILTYEDFNSRAEEPGPFDSILLDVPCSNTGVLAKRIEARYRLDTVAIEQLAQTQSQLLQQAVELVKPGGKICYSTCSIQKEENSKQVIDFLAQNPNFKLEAENLILPSPQTPATQSDHDGGYVAIIARN
ncbi:MAG: transcription antitermination factor NusB [Planctomycetota bacterium]|jgi:16S rRNA (cytosine967-C5)-methyltransferase